MTTLVLGRGFDETIMIGDDIKITVVKLSSKQVRLAITAPSNIIIHRQEIYERAQKEKQEKQ